MASGFRPFAYWTPRRNPRPASPNRSASRIARGRIGRDITDYGQGDFDALGLFLFPTLRTGSLADLERDGLGGMVYAEKLLISQRRPLSHDAHPCHQVRRYHQPGRGDLVVETSMAPTEETGACDGDRGGVVGTLRRASNAASARAKSCASAPGESVQRQTRRAGMASGARAAAGLIGEVSTVNDDETENGFREAIGAVFRIRKRPRPDTFFFRANWGPAGGADANGRPNGEKCGPRPPLLRAGLRAPEPGHRRKTPGARPLGAGPARKPGGTREAPRPAAGGPGNGASACAAAPEPPPRPSLGRSRPGREFAPPPVGDAFRAQSRRVSIRSRRPLSGLTIDVAFPAVDAVLDPVDPVAGPCHGVGCDERQSEGDGARPGEKNAGSWFCPFSGFMSLFYDRRARFRRERACGASQRADGGLGRGHEAHRHTARLARRGNRP